MGKHCSISLRDVVRAEFLHSVMLARSRSLASCKAEEMLKVVLKSRRTEDRGQRTSEVKAADYLHPDTGVDGAVYA